LDKRGRLPLHLSSRETVFSVTSSVYQAIIRQLTGNPTSRAIREKGIPRG
jgi:hypothetical protein